MKIEIHYNLGHINNLGVHHPPQHLTPMHFWGSSDGVEYPYVVDVPEEEGQRLLKAFAEYRWAQQRLGEFAKGNPPKECQCGNCPT